MNIAIQLCLTLLVTLCISVKGFSQETENDVPDDPSYFSQEPITTDSFEISEKINSYIYGTAFYNKNAFFLKAGMEFKKNNSSLFSGLKYQNPVNMNPYFAGAEIGHKFYALERNLISIYLKSTLSLNIDRNQEYNETRYLLVTGPRIDLNLNRFSIGAGVFSGYGYGTSNYYAHQKKGGFMIYGLEWFHLRYHLNPLKDKE